MENNGKEKPMGKIKAKKVTIERVEGPICLCQTAVFDGDECLTLANDWLHYQEETYPKDGCYDKHDFTIVFQDGEEYEGRLDCKHSSCPDPDLDVARHVREFVEFHAGMRCPPHMTPEEYEKLLRTLDKRGNGRAESRAWLEKYEL